MVFSDFDTLRKFLEEILCLLKFNHTKKKCYQYVLKRSETIFLKFCSQ